MTRFNNFFSTLFALVITNCHGFDLTMERKNIYLKGQSYCGLLRCQVDTITEEKVSSLIKMDIYYLNNRILMATILSKDPEIQSQTRNKVNVTGSMSDHHGELRLYFTETADCVESHFICRISFFLASGQTDFSEKSTVPYSREKDGPDLYMKSQISYEQTISDPSGLFLKNLNSPNDFLKNRMGFSLQMGNSDSFASGKNIDLTKNSLVSQTTNHEPDIKEILSELESRMAYMFNISMTQLLMNITHIYEHQKNRNVVGMQQIEKKFQDDYNNSLLELNKKLNDLINKVEVCVTRKEPIQNNNEHVTMKLSLESIYKELNDLHTSQETLRESLANLSSTVMSLKSQETLRESLANLSSNVVTSFKFQDTLRESLDNLSSTVATTLTLQETLRENLDNLSSTIRSLKLHEKDITSDELICERGMNSSFKPREVMTINSNIKTLCDTKTDGGGWIIIQRRVKGDTNFNVSWNTYKHGFGSLQGDFWLGNDVISNLTRTDSFMLRIDMRCENVDSYAVYDYFKVEDETELYTLRLGDYSGNATDRFSYNNHMKFSTYDRDNDMRPSMNCASVEYHSSGWWFNSCSYTNLNGVWGGKVNKDFIYWNQGDLKACLFVEMKLRKWKSGVREFE